VSRDPPLSRLAVVSEMRGAERSRQVGRAPWACYAGLVRRPTQHEAAQRLRAPDLAKLSKDEILDLAWRAGCAGPLLMHAGQQDLYRKYRAWAATDPTKQKWPDGSHPLIFVLEISKRWGKTSWILWVKDEDVRKRPNSRCRIATAAKVDIAEIVDQVFEVCMETCPPDIKPEYQGSRGPLGEGFYYPWNGSFISLVGLDQRPNAGRGRRSDGDVISEAGFVEKLEYVVKNVYEHSYQNIPHARLILESSAPRKLETAWETLFLPDATMRGAKFTATIDDNPRLSQEQRDMYISQAGGRESADCQAEFYNRIVGVPGGQVIPEFDESKHMLKVAPERPRFALGAVAADPGQRDLFALLWGYWDWDHARLVVEADWAARGALTKGVIEVMREHERALWGTEVEDWKNRAGGWAQHSAEAKARMTWWDGTVCRPNPYVRTSDPAGAGMFLNDLSNEYDMDINPTNKQDSKEARLSAVRDAFSNGQIVLSPACTKLASHLRAARWNKQRTDYERTALHGHFDLLDALVYLWRAAESFRHISPNPPRRPDAPAIEQVPVWYGKTQDETVVEALFGVDLAQEVLRWDR
jgi:hypothetical protein